MAKRYMTRIYVLLMDEWESGTIHYESMVRAANLALEKGEVSSSDEAVSWYINEVALEKVDGFTQEDVTRDRRAFALLKTLFD